MLGVDVRKKKERAEEGERCSLDERLHHVQGGEETHHEQHQDTEEDANRKHDAPNVCEIGDKLAAHCRLDADV
jgi:hypothetical protein